MASSNRHWPSMFKSKPCNNPPHHQWQQQHHDINSSLISTACHRSPPYTSGTGTGTGIGIGSCEERSPEPKPRWNPKPEQIRILEAIFNSGMVNPPRDEIRKIRAQLQEYGQVGDANVFYWFQNRKSRSKHKLRHLHNKTTTTLPPPPPPQNSSSNSSSEKSSPKQEAVLPTKVFSIGFSNVTDVVPNSPTATSVTYFHTHNNETVGSLAPPPLAVAVTTPPAEAFFFPAGVQQHQGMVVPNTSSSSQGFCFSELSNVVQGQPHASHAHGPCTSLLLSEIMSHHAGSSSCCTTTTSKKHHHHHHHDHDHDHDEEHDKSSSSSMKIVMQQHTAAAAPHLSFSVTPPSSSSSSPTTSSHHHHHTTSATVAPPIPIPIPIPATTVTVPSQFITQLQGGDGGGVAAAAKSTVFINDVAFEVAVGPFNVREAFGDDALLIHSSGHPVLTNPWGLTLHSLHHGASYYLI